MILSAAIVVLVCFALLVFQYWNRLFSERGLLGSALFAPWVGLGLIVPSVAWLLLNCGVSQRLPPLIPSIALAQSAGKGWMHLFLTLTAPGLLTIGSFWAAISFLHFVSLIALHAEPRAEFAVVAGVLSVVLGPAAVYAAFSGGVAWAGMACLLWLVPLTHCTVALACKPKAKPIYARATARMKLGKYEEAEREVIQQLEKCEEDFEGWMMLAEMYANQFGDLLEAERTVRAVCDQPNVNSVQISLAFHRLADWQLSLGDNPTAAARALDELCDRLPGSHFAKMARLRKEQLPGSRQELLERRTPKKIHLPALTGNLDEPPNKGPALSRPDALALVQECVERLKKNPNEIAPRERLASLLAESVGKADLGIEQLQLLLDMPGQPAAKKAEWLSQQASWHLRHRRDREAAKAVLTLLVTEYPQTAQAFAGQRWLNLLAMEERLPLAAR